MSLHIWWWKVFLNFLCCAVYTFHSPIMPHSFSPSPPNSSAMHNHFNKGVCTFQGSAVLWSLVLSLTGDRWDSRSDVILVLFLILHLTGYIFLGRSLPLFSFLLFASLPCMLCIFQYEGHKIPKGRMNLSGVSVLIGLMVKDNWAKQTEINKIHTMNSAFHKLIFHFRFLFIPLEFRCFCRSFKAM